MREIRYRVIADELRRQIMAGSLAAGAVLPSESDLATGHAVSRVTVRKALDLLRAEGLVDSRQGFGWFVAAGTVRQDLSVLTTIEGQLAEQGRTAARHVVSFGFVPAPPRAHEVLDAETVLEVTRVNSADGHPFALVTVWCPEALGEGLSRKAIEESTFYDLLDVDFRGATQTIGAQAADEYTAGLLEVPVGSPLLTCERVSWDERGHAVLASFHRFPAHLTEFVIDVPSAPIAGEAVGLRLVEPETGTRGS